MNKKTRFLVTPLTTKQETQPIEPGIMQPLYLIDQVRTSLLDQINNGSLPYTQIQDAIIKLEEALLNLDHVYRLREHLNIPDDEGFMIRRDLIENTFRNYPVCKGLMKYISNDELEVYINNTQFNSYRFIDFYDFINAIHATYSNYDHPVACKYDEERDQISLCGEHVGTILELISNLGYLKLSQYYQVVIFSEILSKGLKVADLPAKLPNHTFDPAHIHNPGDITSYKRVAALQSIAEKYQAKGYLVLFPMFAPRVFFTNIQPHTAEYQELSNDIEAVSKMTVEQTETKEA